MPRTVRILLPVLAVAVLAVVAAPASAQSTLAVSGAAYYSSNYGVGLSCSWPSVTGAAEYLVKHYRQDACGSATVILSTTGTSSGSGTHPNCDPDSCYSKTCTVYALSSSGVVLAEGSASICRTGCQSGDCPDCDNDGVCEVGESSSCSDCCGCYELEGDLCFEDFSCGTGGICNNSRCKCIC